MEKPKSRLTRIALGIALIILGTIGLFLPFLQGFIFILIGLVILGWPPAVKILEKIKKKIN